MGVPGFQAPGWRQRTWTHQSGQQGRVVHHSDSVERYLVPGASVLCYPAQTTYRNVPSARYYLTSQSSAPGVSHSEYCLVDHVTPADRMMAAHLAGIQIGPLRYTV